MINTEKTIGNLFKKQRVCFIGSVDNDGFPAIKAMLSPRKREGIKELYFVTSLSAIRTLQYLNNPNACVYFYDKSFLFHGVMLKGSMQVIYDDTLKAQLWRSDDKIHYKKGASDPDYCILKFTALNGRYYHNFISENFEV